MSAFKKLVELINSKKVKSIITRKEIKVSAIKFNNVKIL